MVGACPPQIPQIKRRAIGDMPPRFGNLKKEPIENTAENIFEKPYLNTNPHYCDENKAFVPVGTPLAANQFPTHN
jgi:hypothetical protein